MSLVNPVLTETLRGALAASTQTAPSERELQQPLALLPAINSRDEAEASMALLAVFTTQQQAALAEQNQASINAQKLGERVADFQTHIDRQAVRLEAWALLERKRWPKETKQLELRHGFIGFRWGRPAVQYLKGFTEDLVLARLRKLCRTRKEYREYLQVKESLRRSQILHDYKPEVGRLDDKRLKRIGLKVDQSERFYAEPKVVSE